MRVLHVIPSVSERSGGPATAIVPMCRALQSLGVEVALATTSHGLTQMEMDQIRKKVEARIFPVQVAVRGAESFKYSRPLAKWLDESVREFDLVHVHAVFNHAPIVAARACRKSGIPYVVRPLGTLDPWSMSQKEVKKRLFWLWAGKRMLERSAAVHYTAVAEKRATEDYLGLNHGRVIPLGVEVNGSAEKDRGRTNRYVLVLSRLHPKKNIDVLIDAFKALKLEDWRLVIAGDGPRDYVTTLKEKARDAANIVFVGWVEGERKETLLRDAALLALPSRQENFGLCVMEAMARGVPALISPQVNLAEEIEAAGAGWVVDVSQLGHGLERILKEDREREARGRAAYRLAQNYSWEQTARKLVELYEQIVSNGGATLH
jgi:glycosyltransferase involved in cell wall biosynthesis